MICSSKFDASTALNTKYMIILIIFVSLYYNPAMADKKRIFFFAPLGCLKALYQLGYSPPENSTLSF
jgi:hypothetical protein